MSETPMDALARVTAGLALDIADTTLKTADELEPGMVVKAAGEWTDFVSFDGERLHLRRQHSACAWTYEVGDGERFPWAVVF